MSHHLAQINIGRILHPIDDPRMAGFVAQLDPINALADAAPGFVWRLQSSSGNATDVVYGDDPFVLVNMSVWESLEALRDYTYSSRHIGVFRDRAQWFEKMDQPHYCLWWVPAATSPCRRRPRAPGTLSMPTAPRPSPSGSPNPSPRQKPSPTP